MARRSKPKVREPGATYVTQPLGEVLWLAFKSLTEEDRNAFLSRLLNDPEAYEEIADAVAVIEAEDEPTRPFEAFEEELRREGLL